MEVGFLSRRRRLPSDKIAETFVEGATHLDSAASLIAQKCVDALGGEDSPGLNRAAELLAALVVASGEDSTYRQPSPVDTRRRRRLRIERGLKTSLLDVAVAGAARHKHSIKSYEASLRLAIELGGRLAVCCWFR